MRHAAATDIDSPRLSGPRRAGRAGWAVVAVIAVGLAAALAAGGSDEGGDDPDQSLGEVAESAGARGVAEALRLALVEDHLGPDQHQRDVDVLQESVDDLPGDPDVTGITDSDGDGRDDDGKVEAHVASEVACMTIAMDGDVDVTGGAC